MANYNEKFYKNEWQHAEKDGNLSYAKTMKECYREVVMKRLTRLHHQREESLKMFPLINLN